MAADNCFGDDDDDDDNDASGIQSTHGPWASTIYATRYTDFPLPNPTSTQSQKALPVKLGWDGNLFYEALSKNTALWC